MGRTSPATLKTGQRFLPSILRCFNALQWFYCLPGRNMRPDQFKYSLNTALIVMFGLLHTADGLITYLGLKFTDVDEANPLLLLVAGSLGLGLSIFLLKLLCLSFIALLFFARRNLGNCWSTASLISADAFYSWVIGNNLFLVTVA